MRENIKLVESMREILDSIVDSYRESERERELRGSRGRIRERGKIMRERERSERDM